jgi:hypothetical protein
MTAQPATPADMRELGRIAGGRYARFERGPDDPPAAPPAAEPIVTADNDDWDPDEYFTLGGDDEDDDDDGSAGPVEFGPVG